MTLVRIADLASDWRGRYLVDNQALVIPETIDANRALIGLEESAEVSIQRTNDSLGISNRLIKQAA